MSQPEPSDSIPEEYPTPRSATSSPSSTPTRERNVFYQSGPNKTPLCIPRIPHCLYNILVKQYPHVLSPFFIRVFIPKMAPPPRANPIQPLNGSIDILAAVPVGEINPDAIQAALSATHHVRNDNTLSFAIPYPCNPLRFIHVNIEVCHANRLPWIYFMRSDGYLLQYIALVHQNLGLVFTDEGMYVSLEDIAMVDREKSMLLLTDNPVDVMHFCGYSTREYMRGFRDNEALAQWVMNGRFFKHWTPPSDIPARTTTPDPQPQTSNTFLDQLDRSTHDAVGEWKPTARKEVLKQALMYFGKGYLYDRMIDVHYWAEKERALWRRIRDGLGLEGSDLELTLSGLKKWVSFEYGDPMINPFPHTIASPMWSKYCKKGDEEKLIAWVRANWKPIRDMERRRVLGVGCSDPHLSARFEGLRLTDGDGVGRRSST